MQPYDYEQQLNYIQQPHESKPPLEQSQLFLIDECFVPIFIFMAFSLSPRKYFKGKFCFNCLS